MCPYLSSPNGIASPLRVGGNVPSFLPPFFSYMHARTHKKRRSKVSPAVSSQPETKIFEAFLIKVLMVYIFGHMAHC